MPSHKQDTTFTPPPNVWPLHSSEWVYDEIMRHIEPELMLAVLPTLQDLYKDESTEDFDARMARYDKAFEAFDAAYAKVIELLAEETRGLRNAAHESAMGKEREEAASDLAKTEHLLDSSDA
jgi:hypothetical protein